MIGYTHTFSTHTQSNVQRRAYIFEDVFDDTSLFEEAVLSLSLSLFLTCSNTMKII